MYCELEPEVSSIFTLIAISRSTLFHSSASRRKGHSGIMYLLIGAGIFVLFIFFYLWHLNRAMVGVPDEVQKTSPHRWTTDEIQATYAKIVKDPIDDASHLPPKLERRYVVVGGSGENFLG
jgi:hypothetical protein